MTRELIIRPEAEADLAEAFEWYEARVPGLGLEFIRAVDSLLNSILRNPLAYPVVYKTVRRALARRFPYEAFFVVEPETVVLLAVFHAKRNPQRWQERI
ncbi:MAG: type II toxin-antitoxin system RelE/ParE family toxin [Deltaproteobacteria bacterium]|nr:type II toxin-antitoxin system RelE/ParE family toxin [Deltaproteobacteria bacterium]